MIQKLPRHLPGQLLYRQVCSKDTGGRAQNIGSHVYQTPVMKAVYCGYLSFRQEFTAGPRFPELEYRFRCALRPSDSRGRN